MEQITPEEREILGLYSGQLKTLAKEDYIAARILYISFCLRPARVLALQALEKIVKAICLMNGIRISATGHDISKIYSEQLVPLGVILDEDCATFLSSIGGEYNDVRYETKPINFCRSEVWLLDRCFFAFLRYTHWHRSNGSLSRDHQPMDREFGDLLKSSNPEDQHKKIFLAAESILDGRTTEQIKKEFMEFRVGNNTFWDSFPEAKPQIFGVLNKFIKGFGGFNKHPETYDDKSATTGTVDPGDEKAGAKNMFFAPLSIRAPGGPPVNNPPEWSTYYDEVVYVD
jgi:hypothetical protein